MLAPGPYWASSPQTPAPWTPASAISWEKEGAQKGAQHASALRAGRFLFCLPVVVTMIKKAINNPEEIVPEVIEGLIFGSHGRLVQVPEVNAVMRSTIEANKVGLLIGGGSGHEPMYTTIVGPGFADAAACGNIFAPPHLRSSSRRPKPSIADGAFSMFTETTRATS
jgi:hypothetical protein